MKLIDNWKQWPKMYSQWAFITIAALQANVLVFLSTSQLAAPALFVSATWGELIQSVTAGLAVTGFFARLIDQGIAAAKT